MTVIPFQNHLKIYYITDDFAIFNENGQYEKDHSNRGRHGREGHSA